MKKVILVLSLLVVFMFVISCAPGKAVAGKAINYAMECEEKCGKDKMCISKCIKAFEAIECFSDADCPATEGTARCEGNNLIFSGSTISQCRNPGTSSAECVAVAGGGGGTYCPNGCQDGACLEEEAVEEVTEETEEVELQYIWRVGSVTNQYEMANNDITPNQITGETIRDIATSIGKDQMYILSDGNYVTPDEKYAYTQKFFFDSTNQGNEIVKYAESDNDVTSDFFFIKNDEQIARYQLTFLKPAFSEISDNTGAVDADGEYLWNFKGTKIKILGERYTMVDAQRVGGTNGVTLTLMGGAVEDTLSEGYSQRFRVGGYDYDVQLVYVDNTFAKFTVNGETTNKIQVGGTYTLADGTILGVSDILYQAFAGGVKRATFYLGAEKLALPDGNIMNVNSGEDQLKVNGEEIEGTTVTISGKKIGTDIGIQSITVEMFAEDDFFVPEGQTLSNTMISENEDKEALFTNNWDISYQGLSRADHHIIKLEVEGADDRYTLQWYDGDGNQVLMPFVRVDNGQIRLGSENNALVLDEDIMINRNDYFVVRGGSASDGTAKSYLFQYKGADSISDPSPKIKFKNIGSEENIDYPVASNDIRARIRIDGYTFNVRAPSADEDNFPITVDSDADGDFLGGVISIVDSYGAEISFGETTSSVMDQFLVSIGTPNANDYDNQPPTTIDLTISPDESGEIRAVMSGLVGLTPEGSSDVSYGYTSLGTLVAYNHLANSPQEVTINYPEKQRFPNVYIIGASATVSEVTEEVTQEDQPSSGGGGGGGSYE